MGAGPVGEAEHGSLITPDGHGHSIVAGRVGCEYLMGDVARHAGERFAASIAVTAKIYDAIDVEILPQNEARGGQHDEGPAWIDAIQVEERSGRFSVQMVALPRCATGWSKAFHDSAACSRKGMNLNGVSRPATACYHIRYLAIAHHTSLGRRLPSRSSGPSEPIFRLAAPSGFRDNAGSPALLCPGTGSSEWSPICTAQPLAMTPPAGSSLRTNRSLRQALDVIRQVHPLVLVLRPH